ncbi:hypothetical protein Snoj_07230 [Streptomyces nojiriensis]|uniref:Uncharacterized protein n=1 Tax=Streptomyces nojiriensis TaxID=66374 RepID=A0ABQ3SF93_9ACTN|nr:hypothetical protein GCM10010205_34580 [Streptomyces nojiriensis]GHI66805.1 hypothetical protein Snoj_07230 [Streptomyces nojiriensis]
MASCRPAAPLGSGERQVDAVDGVEPLRQGAAQRLVVERRAPLEVLEEHHREGRLGESSLPFVACTRSRGALRASWNGDPNPFPAAWREQAWRRPGRGGVRLPLNPWCGR